MKMTKYSTERGYINDSAEKSRSHIYESVCKIL